MKINSTHYRPHTRSRGISRMIFVHSNQDGKEKQWRDAICYYLDYKWQRSNTRRDFAVGQPCCRVIFQCRSLQIPEVYRTVVVPVAGQSDVHLMLCFACLERMMGILRRVFQLIFDITWKKEMDTKAVKLSWWRHFLSYMTWEQQIKNTIKRKYGLGLTSWISFPLSFLFYSWNWVFASRKCSQIRSYS